MANVNGFSLNIALCLFFLMKINGQYINGQYKTKTLNSKDDSPD